MHSNFTNYGLFLRRLCLCLISIIILSSNAHGQLTDYRYSMPITIKNNSGTAVVNSQLILHINTALLVSQGMMLANCNDMRFGSDCGASTLYSYWLQGPVNDTGTIVYAKIPSIAANDSAIIYMYFGNPAASSNSALSTFNGPNSSTDSVASGGPGGVGNSQRGFRFSPTTNLLVTSFGKREPTGTTRYVTLFNFNTQAVILQAQVFGGAAQYYYDTLATPIWLTTGTQYLLELFQGAADGYYFGTSSQIGQHLTYYDMRYCNSCTQNTFPTSILTAFHYGYPDFLYYVRDNVVTPEPVNINGLPADTNTPAPPQSLHATQGPAMANLVWRKNTEFDMKSYRIYRNVVNNSGTATLIDSTLQPDTMRTISGLTNGTKYFFWVKAVDRFCSPRISAFSAPDSVIPNPLGIIKHDQIIPKVFALYQNFPNPFNPATDINFDIPKTAFVHIVIYDIIGREVETIVNENLAPGRYTKNWNAEKLASGVYFYRIEAGDFVERKKMVLVK